MIKLLSLRLVAVALLCSVSAFSQGQSITLNLNNGWRFKAQGAKKSHQATVPGEVFTDLLSNQLIADPFYRDNEKQVQWVSNCNWEYETSFEAHQLLRNKKKIELVFDGLDTYADVFLNGKLILTADNMFRQWRINVKSKIEAKNKLLIRFYSAQKKVDSLAKADLPFVIPDNARVYARKAPFHFGWDWGAKLVGCGIWRPVRLEAFDVEAPVAPYKAPVNVQLVQEDDKDGRSFFFKIDGKPVYMKGANYIPSDAFVTRMTKNDYRKVLQQAKDANMNMLRVWGGGIYEHDDFYDLCDSLGIYVWQDFMFACAMVPGDKAFLNNVKEEVKYQVNRLKRHKSIVLWCGNNEVDEGWNRWGWQKQFNIAATDSAKLWNDYKTLFRDSIAQWVKEEDPYRPYISTSPTMGWGVPESIKIGDSHYWGVWWGLEDFEVFEKKTGRFVSEWGMQAMPNYSSILKFTAPADRKLESTVIQHHQKAGNGFQKLNTYLQNYIIDTAKIASLSLEDYTYLSQCVQYYGFKNSILIHRSKEPYNMGTLLWQLNDCWPVASWSITDYYNRTPKAGWYAVKQAYRDDIRVPRDTIKPKDLKLNNPHIQFQVKGNKVTLTSQAFAKYVFVQIDGYEGNWSDNYFDLEPGKPKTISFDRKAIKGTPVIKIKNLWQVIKK